LSSIPSEVGKEWTVTGLKRALRPFIPPVLMELRQRLAGKGRHGEGFVGPVPSWQDAVVRSDGWDASAITEKTLRLALQVRDGAIEFEQDTVPRKKIAYSVTTLAFIVLVLSRHRNSLDVLDFGGSLGTNYYQNRKILSSLAKTPFTWNVVERPVLAELGSKHFANSELKFYASLAEAMKSSPRGLDSFLFTGSIQYVDEPMALIESVVGMGATTIAFDRLLVSPTGSHEVFVQHPDPSTYYRATYPVWCFSRDAFIENLSARGFRLVEHFTGNPDAYFDHCGMLFVRPD
jgi:putative methyltransferase (TIGR04325 family)